MKVALYRLQLHSDFTFADATDTLPYLARLGVSDLYCSPIAQAAQGSQHGYDVVDHSHVNAEMGGDVGFRRLVAALRDRGMGLILDIVPNHMAALPKENRWWWDVLENGPDSAFAEYFDIDWDGPTDKSAATVLVPILGDQYGRVLEAGDLRVERDGHRFVVRYYEHELPASLPSLAGLFNEVAARLGFARLERLARMCAALYDVSDMKSVATRNHRHWAKQDVHNRLANLLREMPEVAREIDRALERLNDNPDRLDQLLRSQWYRLAFWQVASEELDYRRFFNIDTLVALRVENPTVFHDSHRLALELVREGAVSGLRVDHIDGLRDPAGYLRSLADASGGVFTVVEKILESEERLPDWPVAGTTGYEFLNRANGLFVDQAGAEAMTTCYHEFTGDSVGFDDVVYAAKREMMDGELRAEVGSLTALLSELCEQERRHRDFTRRQLREVLTEVIAAFPVYRPYAQPWMPVRPPDAKYVRDALLRVQERCPHLDRELLTFVGDLALLQREMVQAERAAQEFALRFAQVTAPVTAKGVEDTAFYRFHRLISLNEVGGDPGRFGHSTALFHQQMADAAQHWPQGLLTLSTHDTKRSADVRARLNVLSEIPEAWRQAVRGFAAHNKRYCDDGLPDPALQYLIYQTIVGAWPLSNERLLQFVKKAMREAKVHTSWITPQAAYEQAVENFVNAITADSDFLQLIETLFSETHLIALGRHNSLAQTALLLLCPGIPDIYQGSELWDLSLVDPDNRRAVDFGIRWQLLEQLSADQLPELADDDIGANKLWLIRVLLELRRAQPEAFTGSAYAPLSVTGAMNKHVVAFRRGPVLAVVPRLVAGLRAARLQGSTLDAQIVLPEGRYRDVLGCGVHAGGPVAVERLWSKFPVAVLLAEGNDDTL